MKNTLAFGLVVGMSCADCMLERRFDWAIYCGSIVKVFLKKHCE